MTETKEFPISVLCSFINVYRGERDALPAFLTNCQNALGMATEIQKGLLLKYIISRLEGKAQIACSNRVFDDFNDLKSFLKQNFGETKHYNHLLLQLQSCKQQPSESVAQYSIRVEKCLTDLQSEIHNSDSFKKDLPGRIAMTEDLALYTFSLGLKPTLSTYVRSQCPKNLNRAVNIAIEEEKIQNLQSKTNMTSTFKSCKFCNKSGHTESECYHKNRPTRVTTFPSTSRGPAAQPIVCRYCKNIGHDISQCRKRQFNNARNSNNNGNTRPSTFYQQKYLDYAPVTHCNENYDSHDDDGENAKN